MLWCEKTGHCIMGSWSIKVFWFNLGLTSDSVVSNLSQLMNTKVKHTILKNEWFQQYAFVFVRNESCPVSLHDSSKEKLCSAKLTHHAVLGHICQAANIIVLSSKSGLQGPTASHIWTFHVGNVLCFSHDYIYTVIKRIHNIVQYKMQLQIEVATTVDCKRMKLRI